MSITDKIKHKFAKWIWKNNQWVKAVNEIETTVNELRNSKNSTKEIKLKWKFKFLKTPPPNKFTACISLDEPNAQPKPSEI